MVSPGDSKLEKRLHDFLAEYSSSFHMLARLLDEARLSHYSSACGIKSVTFDLFPASAIVAEMLSLLSLQRPYKTTAANGLKDYSAQDAYNPAIFFISYLHRWSGYATTVMHNEGDSPRGVAAAKASILMNDLVNRLSMAEKLKPKAVRTQGKRINEFYKLMEQIGLALIIQRQNEQKTNSNDALDNYHKAMAAALETEIV